MDGLTVSIILLAAGVAFFYFGKNGGLIPKIVFPAAFLGIIALNQLTGTEIVMLTAAALLTFFGFPKTMPVEKNIPRYAGGQKFEEELPQEEGIEEQDETEENPLEETEEEINEEFPEEKPKPLPSRKARKPGY